MPRVEECITGTTLCKVIRENRCFAAEFRVPVQLFNIICEMENCIRFEQLSCLQLVADDRNRPRRRLISALWGPFCFARAEAQAALTWTSSIALQPQKRLAQCSFPRHRVLPLSRFIEIIHDMEIHSLEIEYD